MTPALITPGTKAVFFDAVSTVIHPTAGAPAVYAETAARYGLNLTTADVLTRFIAAFRAEEEVDAAAGWRTSEQRERERWLAVVSAVLPGAPPGCFDELFAHFAMPEAWAVPTEAVAATDHLTARGMVVGLASNYDRRLRSVMAGRPELVALRDHAVISSEVGFRKPAAEFFARVVVVAGCPPDRIAFVGDDWGNDFLGATAAGLNAVLLDPDGRRSDCSRRIATLAELIS